MLLLSRLLNCVRKALDCFPTGLFSLLGLEGGGAYTFAAWYRSFPIVPAQNDRFEAIFGVVWASERLALGPAAPGFASSGRS